MFTSQIKNQLKRLEVTSLMLINTILAVAHPLFRSFALAMIDAARLPSTAAPHKTRIKTD